MLLAVKNSTPEQKTFNFRVFHKFAKDFVYLTFLTNYHDIAMNISGKSEITLKTNIFNYSFSPTLLNLYVHRMDNKIIHKNPNITQNAD